MTAVRPPAARAGWWLSGTALAAFAALAVTVKLTWWDSIDSTVRYWFRPGDEWGPGQRRADLVVEGFQPAAMLALLLVVVILVCWRRHSIRPALIPAVVVLITAALAVTTKTLVARPDTHDVIRGEGGSFPSGHVLAVAAGLTLIIDLVWPRAPRAIRIVPVLMATLMGYCLLVEAAHWATDVAGGALLAVVVLAPRRAFGAERTPRPAGGTASASAGFEEGPHPANAAAPGRADTADRNAQISTDLLVGERGILGQQTDQ